jgi:hypothetical protein
MKTPSLWMIAAGCFGPGICRTRAIWLYKDVKRTATARARAQHTWYAIAGFVIGCALGAACEAAFGLQSLALPTGFALLAFVLGLVASLKSGVSQNSLQGATLSSTIGTDLTGSRSRELRSRRVATSEPEPTQANLTGEQG